MTATTLKPHIWTNIAYVITGCFLIAFGLHIAGVGLLFLGYSSWIAHSKGGKWWYLDWAAMYVSMLGVIAQNTGFHELSFVWPVVVWATMRFRFESVLLTGVLFALAVASAFHAQAQWIEAVCLFGAAIVMRQQTSDGAKDYDLFHGSWHVLTAIGYALLVMK